MAALRICFMLTDMLTAKDQMMVETLVDIPSVAGGDQARAKKKEQILDLNSSGGQKHNS